MYCVISDTTLILDSTNHGIRTLSNQEDQLDLLKLLIFKTTRLRKEIQD